MRRLSAKTRRTNQATQRKFWVRTFQKSRGFEIPIPEAQSPFPFFRPSRLCAQSAFRLAAVLPDSVHSVHSVQIPSASSLVIIQLRVTHRRLAADAETLPRLASFLVRALIRVEWR